MAYKEINIQNKLMPLIQECKNSWIEKDYRDTFSNEEILGMIVSKFCQWDGLRIAKVSSEAFDDANFREIATDLNDRFTKLWGDE